MVKIKTLNQEVVLFGLWEAQSGSSSGSLLL
jgi:hypothetical protein